jgi:cytochrome c1
MCISCHNAHGSTNGFGLRFIAGNVALTDANQLENGTGRYANLCNQCHGQGTSNVESYADTPMEMIVR